MIREMIIIQLNINDKGPYNFILDSGVGLMLVTDPSLVDSVNIPNKRVLKMKGLGGGADFDAYFTSPLDIGIHGLVSHDVSVAILKTEHFGLSNFAGIPIHGLLGYEFFNKLAVKINFYDSTLYVTDPKNVKFFKKGMKIPMLIEGRKPYINADLVTAGGVKSQSKFILDLGAGHPLSIENTKQDVCLPEKFICANLGFGLTGPIGGFMSRVSELSLANYTIKNITTAFPAYNPYDDPELQRSGSIGIGIIKRFDIIIDYPDSLICLKPGNNFKAPFEHDMSGMEYYSQGQDYDHVIIDRVEPGSAADEVGLEKDDEIMAINFKPVKDMTLEQIDGIFKSRDDRSLLLQVYRNKKLSNVIMTLKRRI